MNSKRFPLVLVLVLVAAIAVAGILLARPGAAPNTPADTEPGAPADSAGQAGEDPQLTQAPDFTAYDADGNAVQLSDYFGKPIVLNFWASWCGPCKSEMPDFDAKSAELAGEVQFLMVNMTDGTSETLETASAFIRDSGYSFPVLYDLDQAAAMTYGVQAIPTTLFLDADGNMVAYAQGAIDAATLQQGIDMIAQ